MGEMKDVEVEIGKEGPPFDTLINTFPQWRGWLEKNALPLFANLSTSKMNWLDQ